MKFSHTLSTHLTPEWRAQYIRYEALKTMLKESVRRDPSGLRAQYDSERFLQQCERELVKINTFFVAKLAESKRKHQEQMAALLNTTAAQPHMSRPSYRRKLDEFKLSFSEMYLNFVLLQNYQSLNHTGFRKILKKHDKMLRLNTGSHWFEQNVTPAEFVVNREIMDLIKDIENTFTTTLENGNRREAMKRLRVPPLAEVQHPWVFFRMGLCLGAFLILILVIVISLMNLEKGKDYDAAIRLYRGPFVLTLYILLIGVNTYGWRKYGVNHILIFEIDPRFHLTTPHIVEIAVALGLLWSISILGFIYYRTLGLPRYMFPLALLILQVVFLLNPLPIMYFSSRWWLLKITLHCVGAPFFSVGFADFWFADQLNSLVGCLNDLRYIICFYVTNRNWTEVSDPYTCEKQDYIVTPVVLCFPAWIRFAQSLRRFFETGQSFPFLWNAGKYATTFFVVTFELLMIYHQAHFKTNVSNPFFWLYLVSHIVNSSYCLWWDYRRDMMIMYGTLLREDLLYPPALYYFAIVENFLIRFYWVVSDSLRLANRGNPFVVTSIGITLEVFRRYMWNYFRLENEHLFNTGQFRAVRDIFVQPILVQDTSNWNTVSTVASIEMIS